jgi:adenylate kinase
MLDGFPRNIHQAEALDRYLDEKGKAIDLVINIEVDPEELVKRLTGRKMCRDCGGITHVLSDPSAARGVCGECGGELYQRDDDNEETVRNRLEVYRSQTEPLIDYYRPRGKIADIDGAQTPDDVFAQIETAIESAKAGS